MIKTSLLLAEFFGLPVVTMRKKNAFRRTRGIPLKGFHLMVFIFVASLFLFSEHSIASPNTENRNSGLVKRLTTSMVFIHGCHRISCQEVADLLKLEKDTARQINNSSVLPHGAGNVNYSDDHDGGLRSSSDSPSLPKSNTSSSESEAYYVSVSKLGELVLNEKILDHPWIEKIDSHWQFLPTENSSVRVDLVLQERRPALVVEMPGDSWLVAQDGYPILPLSDVLDTDLILEAGELPRVSFVSVNEPGFGGSIEKRFPKALAGIRSVMNEGGLPFIPERYDVLTDGSLRILPADQKFPTVSMFPRSSLEVRNDLKKINVVLKDLMTKGEKAENIDLRFANQAVVNYGRGGKVPSIVDTE